MSIQQEVSKSDLFADNYVKMLNNSATMVMVSIGHRTGLFDVMATLKPSTSQEIAKKSNLNERYVREWLGAMVTADFITYYPENKTYYLPPEHSSILTRAASPNNFAVFAQYIGMFGTVEKKIIEVFKNGGGLHYDQFEEFHPIMAEESFQTVVSALDEFILPLVPGLKDQLQEGISVLDVGCGSGLALIKLATDYPKSKFVGVDFSEDAITGATAKANRLGLKNIYFKVQDASTLSFENEFDFITTFDAIHDQRAPLEVLKGIHRALKDDGIYLMQDISGSSELEQDKEHPLGPLLYTISTLHCMTVSLAQNGEGLGTMWGIKVAKEYLSKAGFSNIQINYLEHDIQNVYIISGK